MSATGSKVGPAVRRYVIAAGSSFLQLAAFLPGTGAVATVTFYMVFRPSGEIPGWSGADAFLWGTLTALGICLFVAALSFSGGAADKANPAVYGLLRTEYETMKAWLDVEALCSCRGSAEQPGECCQFAHLIQEARGHCAHLGRELGIDPPGVKADVGVRWIFQSGYTSAWRDLHRIQEAVLPCMPITTLVSEAAYDRSRISESSIRDKEELLDQLRLAIHDLERFADKYITNEAGQAVASPMKRRVKIALSLPNAARERRRQGQARLMIRHVRRVINEFRDDRRDGLVRARNNLFRTVVFTGITVYVLFGLALLRDASRPEVATMAAFYLLGAIVGLFRQMQTAASVDTIKEEDYGLTTARLVHTPLFSGIAAVGGVALVALVGSVIPTSEPMKSVAGLDQIFDLGSNEFGLVIAAAFGLTPNLLIVRLQDQAEQYKSDLKSSEASGARSTIAAS